jgi:4-amino-4-deoxy-L-arabinose transferase-like glycosyltransferase
MEWIIFLGFLVAFQVIIFLLYRLSKHHKLTKQRFVIILSLFFSTIFFIGSTGLTNFTPSALVIWGLLTLLQFIAGYLIAPFFGVND